MRRRAVQINLDSGAEVERQPAGVYAVRLYPIHDLDRSRASLDKYVEAQGISWPQYFDGKYWQNDLAMRYGVRSIPTTYLIDRHGKIRYKSLRGKQLENAISQLIAEKI